MSKLSIWITPIWLLAVGVTIGALILLFLWGICWAINRRAAGAIGHAVGEGILRPVSYVVISMAALALLAAMSMPWERTIASLRRLPYVQPIKADVNVPAQTKDFQVAAAFRA